MKISFDFDGTLRDNPLIQEYCVRLIKDTDHRVFVITRRYSSETDDLLLCYREHAEVHSLADVLGINKQNVYFTNREMKTKYIKQLNIDLHIDDDPLEIRLLQIHSSCVGVHAIGAWRYYLDNHLGYNLLRRRYNLYELYAINKEKLTNLLMPSHGSLKSRAQVA